MMGGLDVDAGGSVQLDQSLPIRIPDVADKPDSLTKTQADCTPS
jgi:hypothetical protein